MIRKSLSFLIVFMFIAVLLPSKLTLIIHAAADTVNQQMAVPSGYIGIYSAQDLDNVRNNLSGKYILMNDIDLTDATAAGGIYYNNGAGWNPIGTDSAPFTGTFDGNGYKITGIKESIQSTQFIYAGLFGYAKNAAISNLGIENGSITANNTSLDSTTSNIYAGGIVGYGYNVTITNSYNAGAVSAQSLFTGYAGGIAGYVTNSYNAFSTISNSNNTGDITAKTDAGGIAGYTYRTNISNISNTGKITGQTGSSTNTGGIVGDVSSNTTITNAANSGSITYGYNGGGIAGRTISTAISNSNNQGNLSSTVSSSNGGGIVGTASSTTISNSYNSGKISSSAQYSGGGGIAGWLSSNSSVSNSYNTGDITMDESAGGIAGQQYSNSVISTSYNTGIMTGCYAGGITGWSSSGTIFDSFNIGSIKGKYDSGGIAGYATNTSIQNTYNVGSVVNTLNSASFPIGGIAGQFDGSMQNSYYLNMTFSGVGKGITDGTISKTFDQLQDSATFTGFNFSTTWKVDGNSSFHFPVLNQMQQPQTESNLNICKTTLPEKIEYAQGDSLDLSGAVITVRTNFGNQFTVPVSADMVTGYDPNKIGYQSLKISYNGLFDFFSVVVDYTVTFKDYDGTTLKTELVKPGNTATAPDSPTRTGYIFSGWSPSIQNVKSNFTVTAQYSPIVYSIAYMDGDSSLYQIPYNSNTNVTRPADPVKSGYTFIDWYTGPDLQTKYQFYNNLTGDITLYAKFVQTPDIPQNLAVEPAGFNKANVTWNSLSGVDGFEIARADAPDGDYNNFYITGSNEYLGYTIDTLETGKAYNFKIRAYRIVDGQYIYGSYTPVVSFTPELMGVTSVKAVNSGFDQITLSWAGSSEADGYEIFRSDASNGTYTQAGTVTGTYNQSFNNRSLLTGKAYFYKIRAYRTVNDNKIYSSFSNPVSAAPSLAASASIHAASAGYNRIFVNWVQVSGATGYELYRSTTKTGTYSFTKAITSSSILSQTDSSLTTGRTYYYKIRAYRLINGTKVYSPFSGITSAAPVLAVPSKITAAKASSTSIKLTWSKAPEASGYEVYRATSKYGTFTNIKTLTAGSAVSFTNMGLTRNKTYYFKVRTYLIVNRKKIYSSYTTTISYKL